VEIYLLNGDVIPLSPAEECAKQIYYYSFFLIIIIPFIYISLTISCRSG
jgi:hypothetical protein